MKYKEFNEQIIELVGGKDNVKAVVHCMTRLRFTLKDVNRAQTEAIKNMDGVIDVVSNNVAYQIIVGTHVNDVYKELIDLLGLQPSKEVSSTEKKNIVKAILDVVSESMNPILEPIICAGLLAALLSIVSLTGIISPDSSTYQIFDALRSAVFYFLPIFMAMSSAKRLGVSPYLAVALAATILSEPINDVAGLNLFGIPLPQITYANSFIPILLAIWFMGYVTKFVKKIVPNSLQYFLTPLLIMAIMLPATLLFFGPLGYYLGEGIIAFFNLLMKYVGSWFVMMLYSGLQPFIIMLGAGNFIMPVVASLIASNGYDPAFISSATISDIAVGGAMLGYFIRTRNSKQKQLFGTVTLSAILGVTEPAIYGVFVKFRRPFIAVMIGGGLGGLFAGITGVKAYSVAWGLLGLPSYIGQGDFKNLWLMVSAVVISFVGAAIAAYLLGIPADEATADDKNTETIVSEADSAVSLRSTALSSVAQGSLVQLSEVADQAFSTGALGKGIGIIPEKDEIYSPIDGEITVVFPTKHAIGIKGLHGEEVLIHIGIDTVSLEGQFFDVSVKQGDTVKKGQKIGQVDFEQVQAAGFDSTIMVVITNTGDYLDVIPMSNKKVQTLDESLNIILE
ncbi:PTS beta-glucoside transporter subunit EIIBCA [Enterococcus sp. JM4C]|uniref:beta-glucoside-specific PTS transporter subunit IIABC n=1 Tax=Candidatus Enterococcus huntleyi TaxID=1857217 RepID=UPI001379A6B5|nr:beta-glucoside-specific PTS transporter subunit IIABC [Enterococcus sp. JM4C]KAF1297526.1 PTS beta-glucoside transporter subunit EIIBCA [Enterococcus sp. JM4C]